MYRIALTLFMLLLLAACQDSGGDSNTTTNLNDNIPDNAVQISIYYSAESDQYMPEIMERFNQAYREGRNPVTGQALASGERPIYITGGPPPNGLSSGGLTEAIVSAALGSTSQNALRPTLFAPSVSHWLSVANNLSGRQLFDVEGSPGTAYSPVVMAIWESRLNAIRQTVGYDDIGWEELLGVLNSPNGWADYGIPDGRRAVYYGHADPRNSSTALSALISEYYACARESGYQDRRMQLEWIRDPQVQDCVRQIEQLVKHYAFRTEDFLPYIAQGPEYLDFLAVEEVDIICLNTGGRQADEVCNKPAEKLVALYPKEGTFRHEHPIAIVNADWVTPEQREAALVFIDFLLMVPQQELVMSYGFRPANPDVQLAYPFVEENGVTVEGPQAVIDIPPVEVLLEIQNTWSLVRKQADIVILLDVSGSMQNEGRLDQAKIAAEAFLDNMESTNRVGLYLFNDDIEERVPLNIFETNEVQLRSHIRGLRADGGTELFASLRQVVQQLNATEDEGRIRAVVLLSDGEDTGDMGVTLDDVIQEINASRDSRNPIIVVPVAYGSDADSGSLLRIAQASATQVVFGDPENILNVLEVISSQF